MVIGVVAKPISKRVIEKISNNIGLRELVKSTSKIIKSKLGWFYNSTCF